MKNSWKFEAFDTFFFRESKPFGISGGNELNSVFPPPARTIAGVVRTAIGETTGVCWEDYKNNQDHSLRNEIGYGDDIGPLKFSGPYLSLKGTRLFPMPFCLVKDCYEESIRQLLPENTPTRTDIGNIYLPLVDPVDAVAKPMDGAWLKKEDFEKFLNGEIPEFEKIVENKDLFKTESRIGIAIDHLTKTTGDGNLFQTSHLRIFEGTAIESVVEGVSDKIRIKEHFVCRLGGEGRPAGVSVSAKEDDLLCNLKFTGKEKGLMLIFITSADFGGQLFPEGFVREGGKEGNVWKGKLGGINVSVHSIATGRPIREGGWDLVERRPRNLKSLCPAGTVWYIKPEGDLEDAVKKINGIHIGNETEIGRGETVVGLWKGKGK